MANSNLYLIKNAKYLDVKRHHRTLTDNKKPAEPYDSRV